MKAFKFLLIGVLLSSTLISAQDTRKSISEFQIKTQATITVNETSGIPEFIKFPSANPLELKGNTIVNKAFNFLETNKGIYNIDSENDIFNVEKTEVDEYGLKHLILNQEYKGVPVYDGKLHFHFNEQEKLTSINGNYISTIKLIVEPSLNKSEANIIALRAIENQDLNFSGETLKVQNSTLYIFAKGLIQGHVTSNYLVYEVEVRNDLDVREFVFVNAHNGEIVQQFTGMAHAINRVIYEGNTANVVWAEGDALPGSLTIWQQNEVIASEHMYNFFNNAFGYVSYNGADAQMRTINNSFNISCPNASWNGSTTNFCDGTASDDVIAHEWGHAYTGSTSSLIYAYQSGAMNESFSDIWGETIDLLNGYEDADDDQSLRTSCGSSDRWRIGEDASAFGGAIRDMWNPPCNGDPGKVTDGNYRCGTFDSGGVHSNSGIPNHAYALLVDGGSYNGQVINGIGFTKAAHIFWRVQSQYLTATSDFSVLADALEAATTDLIGVNLEGLSTTNSAAGPSGEIITASDLTEVINVVLAVELRIEPDGCNYTPILAPISDLCDAATSNPIFFEDWENGIGSWTVEQLPVEETTWESRDWVIENSLPKERMGSAIFGVDPINGNCTTDLENGIIRLQSPVINFPNFLDGTFDMAFNHNISTEDSWDGANIKYSINSGPWSLLPTMAFVENAYNGIINPRSAGNDNPMHNQDAFTGSDEGSTSGSWGTSVINLSLLGVLPNDTIQFRFEVGTDGCNGRVGWYIDEIMIYNCSEPLSVSDFNQINQVVSVYPNPSNGIFTLLKKNAIDLVKAEVYDINGRFIKYLDLSNMQISSPIDLTTVSSGIYFLSITSSNSKTTIKLLKQ